MNLELYREKRRRLVEQQPRHRELCTKCLQPEFGCYCALVRPFDPKIQFVILIDPIERRRRIATGRMSHLCLEGSRLLVGRDFSHSQEVDAILAEESNDCVTLYPGPSSVNLSVLSTDERVGLFSREKRLTIFVIDGTWATSRKMARSRNLAGLPRICFSPQSPSRFQVRKQPAPGCFSTIEAIHQTIDLLGEARGFELSERRHDGLLRVFDSMVSRQVGFVQAVRDNRQLKYRRDRLKADQRTA